MDREKFRKTVEDGIRRKKNFMIIKLISFECSNPTIVIFQREDIIPMSRDYEHYFNYDFSECGYKIEDILMTSNLNELSWFAY